MDRFLRELESPQGPSKRLWRFAAALAVGFVLLIAIAGYGVLQERRAAAARAFVDRSLAIQETVLALQDVIALMEVHQRGFLVTGDPRTVMRREAAYASGQGALRQLRVLVANNPMQLQRANRVATTFVQRHERMRQVSAIADRQGMEAARTEFILRGASSVDAVLASLASLRDGQRRLLADRTRQAQLEATRFRAMLVYGTGLALLLVAVTSLLMLRQLARNARLTRALIRMHALEEEKTRELERSNRELEAFTYTVSHDLRAPLRHVDGYARMLQEDAGDQLSPDMRRYLDAISDSSRRMGALIDDLLALSRLGRKPIERVRLDMNLLTERVLHEAGAGFAPVQVEVGPLPSAHADPVLMRQAWVNLLSNAIKYSAPRGAGARIQISGEQEGATTRYRIRDNGVGFDMRYAEKLFGVFQRMHSQDQFEGTGVGLAIVQQVVQRHGGKVYADAVPDQGACFTIELPTLGTATEPSTEKA